MRWIDCSILRNIYNSYLQEVIMKRKRNHSLRSSVFIFLAALFLLFTCSVSTIYASTLQKPDIAASGKFVKDGDYWIYRYDDKTIAKNVFLKIDKKTCSGSTQKVAFSISFISCVTGINPTVSTPSYFRSSFSFPISFNFGKSASPS